MKKELYNFLQTSKYIGWIQWSGLTKSAWLPTPADILVGN